MIRFLGFFVLFLVLYFIDGDSTILWNVTYNLNNKIILIILANVCWLFMIEQNYFKAGQEKVNKVFSVVLPLLPPLWCVLCICIIH